MVAKEQRVLTAARSYLASLVGGRKHLNGPTPRPDVMLADAGYWHQKQMEEIVSRGTQVLIPPDADRRKGGEPRKGWDDGFYKFMRRALQTEHGALLYRKRHSMSSRPSAI